MYIHDLYGTNGEQYNFYLYQFDNDGFSSEHKPNNNECTSFKSSDVNGARMSAHDDLRKEYLISVPPKYQLDIETQVNTCIYRPWWSFYSEVQYGINLNIARTDDTNSNNILSCSCADIAELGKSGSIDCKYYYGNEEHDAMLKLDDQFLIDIKNPKKPL